MSQQQNIATFQEAQDFVKQFAQRNGWKDVPNIDKFDHVHEELLEMSQHLRYQDEAQRIATIKAKHDIFVDGVGDTMFALCRLANQLGIDMQEAFNYVAHDITSRYQESTETKHTPDGKA